MHNHTCLEGLAIGIRQKKREEELLYLPVPFTLLLQETEAQGRKEVKAVRKVFGKVGSF